MPWLGRGPGVCRGQAAAAAPKAWRQLAPAGISRPARPAGAGATARRGR